MLKVNYMILMYSQDTMEIIGGWKSLPHCYFSVTAPQHTIISIIRNEGLVSRAIYCEPRKRKISFDL